MEKTFQLVDKQDLVKIAGGQMLWVDIVKPCPWPKPKPIQPKLNSNISMDEMLQLR